MTVAKRLVVGLLCLLLASCQPTMEASLYNNTGRDLVVDGATGNRMDWKAGEYLTIHNALNDIFKTGSQGELALDILDTEGRRYRYLIDKDEANKAKELYYLWYFRATSATSVRQSVTPVPKSASIHLRIDPDMALYWFGDFNGVKPLKDEPIPEQPGVFPIRPLVIGADN